MSNLTNAIKALAKKNKYEVIFQETETHTVIVEAIDQESASEEANEIYNNGGASSNGDNQSEEISCNQI